MEKRNLPLREWTRRFMPNISKHSCISKGHEGSVVRMMRKEIVESFLRKLRLLRAIVRRRTVKLLGRVSKSLVKYGQHFLLSHFWSGVKGKPGEFLEYLCCHLYDI